jgi:hypothetical protein
MAGGLLNLVSQSSASVFLMGNPSKTFFKTTYSKHTNFGLQKFRIDYDGIRDLRLTEPSVFSFKVPRYADLLMDTYLVVTIPDIYSPIYHPCVETGLKWAPYEFQWVKYLGTTMIQEIEITCGNFSIAKFSGDYLRNMVERDFPQEKKNVFYRMIGHVPELNRPAGTATRMNAYPSAYYMPTSAGAEPSIRGRQLYIPINAWFTLNSKMAFPLVSLQYNELHINVTMRPIKDLFQIRDVFDPINRFPYVAPDFTKQEYQLYRYLQTPPYERVSPQFYTNQTNGWNADIHLLGTYCFLSEDEARLFASKPQTYLVRDVVEYEYQNVVGTKRLTVPSTGMVSNWMMYLQRNDVNLRNEWNNYTNWPYGRIPYDLIFAPPTSETIESLVYIDPITQTAYHTGPMYDVSGTATNIYTTGPFNPGNNKDILLSIGILLNGAYRENTMERGVFDYVEKYVRTAGDAPDGLYCYNFCLSTDPFHPQPSGAINMTAFRSIEVEVTTFVPQIDPNASNFNFICDGNGNFVGTTKQNWRLYEYTYNMKIMEERYNLLTFKDGNCGLQYIR